MNTLKIIEAVKEAQGVLGEFILPGSGITEEECIGRLMGILDNTELAKAMAEDNNRIAPETSVHIHAGVNNINVYIEDGIIHVRPTMLEKKTPPNQ